MLSVTQLDKWTVFDDGRVVAEFDTSAEAWRYVDRNEVHSTHLTRRTADKVEGWKLPKRKPAP
jgi:hypothetical protein